MVIVAVQNALESLDRGFQLHIDAGSAGKGFGHMERLRQETLDTTRTSHDKLVVVGQFVHTEDGDDVLKLFVLLQHLLHAASHAVVLFTHNVGVKNTGGGVKRVHGGVNAKFRNLTGKHERTVKVREGGRRSRVGQVVGGDVYGLHRGDGPLLVEVIRSCSEPRSVPRVADTPQRRAYGRAEPTLPNQPG